MSVQNSLEASCIKVILTNQKNFSNILFPVSHDCYLEFRLNLFVLASRQSSFQ